jgi:hypothetical protein
MKAFLKITLLFAMLLVANVTLHAQNNLVYNTEKDGDLVVSETIFKMQDGALNHYMKHNYKYDANKQRIESETQKWNDSKKRWENDLCIRYTHNESTITTEYYKWNKKKKEYILVPEMTVTMSK